MFSARQRPWARTSVFAARVTRTPQRIAMTRRTNLWKHFYGQFGDLGEIIEVFIGQHHAAVARTRGAAVSVARRAVQPDAMAVPPFTGIPLVGVVERERPSAVEVAQPVTRWSRWLK